MSRVCTLSSVLVRVALPVLLVGCAGVPKSAVTDATTAVSTQLELAKASLALCRGGEAKQCDSVERNLANIGSTNESLAELAQGGGGGE
jgi:hypothetical protein